MTNTIEDHGDSISAGGVLSDDERQRVEGILAWRYGIESKLSSDHKYKNAPPEKE